MSASYDHTPERAADVLWLGTDGGEITPWWRLAKLLEPERELTQATLATYAADKEQEPHPPPPVPQRISDLIDGREIKAAVRAED